ncbi:reverse transcriptase domain-containing protein [Tanacetum coccineum]
MNMSSRNYVPDSFFSKEDDERPSNSFSEYRHGEFDRNLAYSRFMFTVYPQYGISLDTKDLDQTLAFVHGFERSVLYENQALRCLGLTNLVAYASAFSIQHRLKRQEYIGIVDLFNDIGKAV